MMTFSDFALSAPLLANLAKAKITQPTPIQQQAIPLALQGGDLFAKAHTGSGKTFAFVLPILELQLRAEVTHSTVNLQTRQKAASKIALPQAVILLPTRELAAQVAQEHKRLAKGTGLKAALIIGGEDFNQQAKALQSQPQTIIATPGRLLEHLKKRHLRVDQINQLVFDEADRMLDMGFKEEILALIKKMPTERQTLLFSATSSDSMWQFNKLLLKQPQVIEIEGSEQNIHITERLIELDAEQKTAATIYLLKQHLLKPNLLKLNLLKEKPKQQVLIFRRTKEGVDKLVEALQQAGLEAQGLHADKSPNQRQQTYTAFKEQQLAILVATDVAARGLDIKALPCIINFELPLNGEDYTHRIGRTGRAGEQGMAITLFSEADSRRLEDLEALLDKRLPREWLTGFEPDLLKPASTEQRAGRQSLAAQKQRAKKRALK